MHDMSFEDINVAPRNTCFIVCNCESKERKQEGRETPLSPHPAGQPSSSSSPRGLGYTCGPIDGSLYAVVQSSGGGVTGVGGSSSTRDARGSPLTVSMDSGISSAPPQRASPPEIPDADAQAHGDLDKLLQDMMLTVESIPDPPTDDSSRSFRNGTPKMFIHDHQHHQQPSNHQHRTFNGSQPSSSNYSTLKGDSYRTYTNTSSSNNSNANTVKESSPAYSSSSYSSTLKHHNGRNTSNSTTPGGYDAVDYQRAISPESKNSVSFSPSGNIDFIDEDIPYHARQTSQPFSYGATNEMIKHQKLSSPSLVRKASVRGGNSAPVVDLDEILGENGTSVGGGNNSGLSNGSTRSIGSGNLQHHNSARSASNSVGVGGSGNSVSKRPVSPFAGSNATPEPPPEFANSVAGSGGGAKSPGSEGSDGASWLKQQQLKLAARRDERSPARLWRQESGNRMIGELRNVVRSRLRHDGYQSDSAVLDEDDDVWHPNPNHVQTGRATMNGSAPASPLMGHRTMSRKMNGGIVGSASFNNHNRSRADSANERPFVAAKRAYEFRKYNDVNSHNDSTSSWTERSVSPGSVQNSSVGGLNGVVSRPQTPAFPVHPRTPYNNASPTVTFASDRINPQHQHQYSSVTANNHINNSSSTGHSAIYIEERRDTRETGLPPKSPTTQRKDRPISPLDELISHNSYGRSPGTPSHFEYGQSPKSAMSYTSINSAGGHTATHLQYYGSRRSSLHSNSEPAEVADVNVKFVRDTSKIWYKPNISREQAIGMLRDAAPGTFVVRDSNSFPGAFGLALKVAIPPPGAPPSSSGSKEPGNELVRHFLIEPTSRGVRLKGCANEPVFSSLSALVYQHSLTAMALPCTLLLPEPEAAARALDSPAHNSPQQLLAQGAACNVLYLFTLDTESLTGPQAIKKAATVLFDQKPRPSATIVHFKVSSQGITLTDNARKLFFRRHYPTNNISYCGLDTEERTWDFISSDTGRALSEHRCFGFVARKPAHKSDNQCHIFAELEPEQPATAIVNFVNKVLMGSAHAKANIV
ncbi:hypothetical protein QAD02_023064 [Eretmocerus hayati]|uniref:Uncharacterized protein n=1 Tax=Eretmocerus hayati TaxID=131215 RepID=A0ACC2PZP3_9HYME|nr:hypothetical protein QAD02_023064 [Eretmocerus hayati]